MWRELASTLKQVITLAEDLKRYQDDVKELRQEVRSLAGIVQRLTAHMQATERTRAAEHENEILRLQLAMKEFEQRIERRLPAPPNED